MDDLAHTVAKLQAAEDIRHLKARYARVCDTGYKPAGMVGLFTSDAVWDAEGTRAIAVAPDGPKAVWLSGGYADRYRKEGGAWKFAEVLLDVQTIAPFEDGWVRQPFWND